MFKVKNMHNLIDDLLILKWLRVARIPAKISLLNYIILTLLSIGWFKVNIDGAARRAQGTVVAGWVIQDRSGKVVVGFFSHLGMPFAFEAELMVVMIAFRTPLLSLSS